MSRPSGDPTAARGRIDGVFSAALVSALVLAVPHGWHTIRMNPTLKAGCDPVTLLVVVPLPSTSAAPGRMVVLPE